MSVFAAASRLALALAAASHPPAAGRLPDVEALDAPRRLTSVPRCLAPAGAALRCPDYARERGGDVPSARPRSGRGRHFGASVWSWPVTLLVNITRQLLCNL